MARATIEVLHKITLDPDRDPATGESAWQLYLQWARWCHAAGYTEVGYRYIWRRPDRSWQPARGQARIPSLQRMRALKAQAEAEGWGDLTADNPEKTS